MMNPVHAWRYDEQIQNSFQFDRQAPVGMMKERTGLKCDEEDDQHQRRDAKDHYCKRKKADRENHFAEMKSRGGCHVEVEIGVVHVMKSPEERHHVHRVMPPPVGV